MCQHHIPTLSSRTWCEEPHAAIAHVPHSRTRSPSWPPDTFPEPTAGRRCAACDAWQQSFLQALGGDPDAASVRRLLRDGQFRGVSTVHCVVLTERVQALALTSSFLAAHGQGPQHIASIESPVHTHRTLQARHAPAAPLTAGRCGMHAL